VSPQIFLSYYTGIGFKRMMRNVKKSQIWLQPVMLFGVLLVRRLRSSTGTGSRPMIRTAKKSAKEPADTIMPGRVLQRKWIQVSLFDIVGELYLFLLNNKYNNVSYFKTFPKDCCYFATFFAALVLERLGYDCIYWVFGYRGSTGSHIWCECNGFIIDLTSGQYTDSSREYLIYKEDMCSNTFHSSFEVVEKGLFDDRFRHDSVYSDFITMVDDFIATLDEVSL